MDGRTDGVGAPVLVKSELLSHANVAHLTDSTMNRKQKTDQTPLLLFLYVDLKLIRCYDGLVSIPGGGTEPQTKVPC